MLFPKRNQKQVAARLRGNLDYYNRRPAWRTWRWWISGVTLLAGIAAVPAYYRYHGSESVMNPGPISLNHNRFANDCASCHPQTAMIRADSHQAGKIVRAEYFVPIDQACLQCHQNYGFHAPNTVPDLTRPVGTGARKETSSCTSCHREHVTAGKMLPATNQNCAACHNRQELMTASAQLGQTISTREFPDPNAIHPGSLLYLNKGRPKEGYPKAFAAFDQGHPGFQIQTRNLQDPDGDPARNPERDPRKDLLQYNHARHVFVEEGIPKTQLGNRLDCDYCHKADATGSNFQRVTFETGCAACHAMNFDRKLAMTDINARDPGLAIPHGDAEKARNFLVLLPNKYLEYAQTRLGMNETQAKGFAQQQLADLTSSYGLPAAADYRQNWTELERRLEERVFYSKDHLITGVSALYERAKTGGGQTPDARDFRGCAYCHQVNRVPDATPTITKPVIVDRWLSDGRFDHAQHKRVQSCRDCHTSIRTSEKTSDVNIPTQKSCTQCHNSTPRGVANECLSCHGYHNDPDRRTVNRTDVKAPRALDAFLLSDDPERLGALRGTTRTPPIPAR